MHYVHTCRQCGALTTFNYTVHSDVVEDMIINLQLGSSCKTPEVGDIFISPEREWSATGYFTIVFEDYRVKENYKLRTMPLVFAQSLNPKEFIGKISVGIPSHHIMPVGKIKFK